MVHAFSREAHNLLSVRNMRDSNRLSTTQHRHDTETGCACLEPGHTMMWLLGASTISYYQEMAAEERPAELQSHDRAEYLYDNKPLPHPARAPITALRTFFGIAMLAGVCAWLITSLAYAAELFPYSPPASQQRGIEQTSQVRPQLSQNDINRIARIADQAKKLTPAEQQQLQGSIRQKLKGAVTQGNLNHAQYYTELLTQIGQESR